MQSTPKKIALVTGANKDIGFEVARQPAVSGSTVLPGARIGYSARKRQPGSKAKAETETSVTSRFGPEDSVTVATAAQSIAGEFGHLDILVDNAGSSCRGTACHRAAVLMQ
jgi:NAD(P)-dependent dehydrogenase (short-subunit alcohol dehydrogenase family)